MDRNIITIEQIIDNPNLDLTERINYYANNKNIAAEDLTDLAIATIKNEYEYWFSHRTNKSDRTDTMLVSILNGHMLNNVEAFEMMCDDMNKVKEYSKYEFLKKRISDNNGITKDDFDNLCAIMEVDNDTKLQMEEEFNKNGLIIEEYADEYSHQR